MRRRQFPAGRHGYLKLYNCIIVASEADRLTAKENLRGLTELHARERPRRKLNCETFPSQLPGLALYVPALALRSSSSSSSLRNYTEASSSSGFDAEPTSLPVFMVF